MDGPDRMTCDAFVRLLDAFVSGEVSAAERRRGEAHLAECPACAAGHAFETALDRAIRSKLAAIEAPRPLRLRIEALIAAHADAENPQDWRSS